MYNENKLNQSYFLIKNINDINCKLLEIFLNGDSSLDKFYLDSYHKVQPEILVEVNSNDINLQKLKNILVEDCMKASIKNFGYTLVYIRFKLGLLLDKDIEGFSREIEEKINYNLFLTSLDIDLLYGFLFWAINPHYKRSSLKTLLLEILESSALFFLYKGILTKYSLSLMIIFELDKNLASDYLAEQIDCINSLRLKDGSYGFDNPFYVQKSFNDKLIDTFYCSWALKKMTANYSDLKFLYH